MHRSPSSAILLVISLFSLAQSENSLAQTWSAGVAIGYSQAPAENNLQDFLQQPSAYSVTDIDSSESRNHESWKLTLGRSIYQHWHLKFHYADLGDQDYFIHRREMSLMGHIPVGSTTQYFIARSLGTAGLEASYRHPLTDFITAEAGIGVQYVRTRINRSFISRPSLGETVNTGNASKSFNDIAPSLSLGLLWQLERKYQASLNVQYISEFGDDVSQSGVSDAENHGQSDMASIWLQLEKTF